MNDYFQGCIRQQLVRGQLLLKKIPAGVPREFEILAMRCRDRLGRALKQLRALIENADMLEVALQPERLRRLRRAVREMDFLETVGISALERNLGEDVWLNQFLHKVVTEIHYPLVTPVVTPLSQAYFEIFTDLMLLRVPLAEGNFLLHLPDLYHELSHPFFFEENDPRVQPFVASAVRCLQLTATHFYEETVKHDRRNGPQRSLMYIENWQRCWRDWTIEFFCDLYAVCMTGPAYAWSHLHLAAKRGEEVFNVPRFGSSSHPPDGARMTVMLLALQTLGFTDAATSIEAKWTTLTGIEGSMPDPEYHQCFPENLLQGLVEQAVQGVGQTGCLVVSPGKLAPISGVLNAAWDRFWADPTSYSEWEREKVLDLKATLGLATP